MYLLNREQHTVGQETPSARPNICLFSPDILPLHCRLRRVPAPRRHANNNKGEELAESQRFCVAVEPVLHATVLVNFSRCDRSTTLRHGDLLSFGAHYIFLYKDPTGAKPLPAQTLARLRSLGQLYDAGVEEGEGGAQTCKMCGSVLKDRAAQVSSVSAVRRSFKPHLVKPRSGGTAPGGPLSLSGGESGGRGGGGQKRRLQLEFDQAHEDQLLNRIMSLIEPGGLCSDLQYNGEYKMSVALIQSNLSQGIFCVAIKRLCHQNYSPPVVSSHAVIFGSFVPLSASEINLWCSEQ